MKPLLLIAAIALAALALCSASDDPPTTKTCPECPGGVCPVSRDHLQPELPDSSFSLQERTIQPISESHSLHAPVQVMPVPLFTLAKHERSFINPQVKAPETKVHEPKATPGAHWRLRLLYTKGDKQATKLLHWFENRMPVISKKYDFKAVATDEDMFEPWQKAGYTAEKPTLILACPDDIIALKTSEIPKDIDELRILIRSSADKYASHSK